MNYTFMRCIIGAFALAMALPASAQLITHRDLSLSLALNMATGALEACDYLSIPVPDKVAIIGFDDIELAGLSRISLTTLRVPAPRREAVGSGVGAGAGAGSGSAPPFRPSAGVLGANTRTSAAGRRFCRGGPR